MKYIKPNYENETVETCDVLLTSPGGIVDFRNGATLTETEEGTAKVGASALDVLGIR